MSRRGRSVRRVLLASFLLTCAGCTNPEVPLAQSSSHRCPPTAADIEGPFYEPNAPLRNQTGRGLKVTGHVRSAGDCRSLQGARIEWWSADTGGNYSDAHRATVFTDKAGVYRYETVFPRGYSFRPPHLHVKVSANGYRTLTTQLYPKEGQQQIAVDFNLVPKQGNRNGKGR